MAAAHPLFMMVSIYNLSCSRTLLDWTIADVLDERTTVDAFYKMALAMCDPSVLQRIAKVKHCVEEAKIGKDKNTLMRISNTGR